MSATVKSHETRRAQPAGKAEPLERLKALARVLARQAAAEPITSVDPLNKSHNTVRVGEGDRQFYTSKRDPHAICCARNRETSDGQAAAQAALSNAVMSSTSKTGTMP